MATQSPKTFIPISDPALQVFEPTVILQPVGFGTANVTVVEIDQRSTTTYQVKNVQNDPGGSVAQVQFNTGTAFGGDSGMTYNSDTDSLNITGNVVAGAVWTNTLKYANGVSWGSIGASGWSGTSGTNGLPGTSGYSGFSGVWVNNVTILENLGPASTHQGMRAMITNGNLVATGNFGAVITDGGANIVPIYSDGTDWLVG